MRTGYRLALTVAGITIVLAVLLAVIAAVGSGRDAAAYGRVSIPGRNSVNLPAGEVIIYYGARVAGGRLPPNAAPSYIRLRVRTTNGQQLVGTTPYRSDEFRDDGYVRRAFAKLSVPEAGQYEAVSPTRVPGASGPVISFGHSGSRNFGYALFVLSGGLLLAAILAVVTRLSGRF